MIIHIVCTGNTYRSRLAEAYINAKRRHGITAVSSGIGTAGNGGVPLSPYAADLLAAHGISAFASRSWKQTTPELLAESDYLVFMEECHHDFCKQWLDPRRQQYEIWHIRDVDPSTTSREQLKKETQDAFNSIMAKADDLLARLTAPSYEAKSSA